MNKFTLKQSGGFTIIELLIATSVLAVLLLIGSGAIVGLTGQFYKGVNQSRTQEVTRLVTSEIASNIQYSSVPPYEIKSGPNTVAWCIAGKRYSFAKSTRLEENGSNYALFRDDNCLDGPATPLLSDGQELLEENMRLVDFQINGDASKKLYEVIISVGLGEDDQFCSPTVPGSCSNTTTMSSSQLRRTDLQCRGGAGTQFCAVSRSSLVVVTRL